METITWQDFEKIELRAGTIIEVNDIKLDSFPMSFYKCTSDNSFILHNYMLKSTTPYVSYRS